MVLTAKGSVLIMKIKRNQKIERTSKKQGPNGTPVKAAPKPKMGTQIIPKERYTSRDYMQQEWDKLWTKVWLLACREEDLPEPGDHYVTEIGVESTILHIVNNEIHILRHGGISTEKIKENFPNIKIYDEQQKYKKIIAPGMLAKHYSPTVPLRINAKKAKKNELLIGFGSNYDSPNLSFKGDLTEAASNLFSFLAKYQKKFSKIAIAPIPNIGIGRAINDRIKRASKN